MSWTSWSGIAVVTLFSSGLVVSAQGPQALTADYVLVGGLVLDGSGQPACRADVALRGDQILAVGADASRCVGPRFDVTGCILSSGFIDLRNHSDESILEPGLRAALNYLYQGVTTIVTGNCGAGHVGVGWYYDQLEQNGVGVNVAHLLPHGALRGRVMGNAKRPSTQEELERMKRMVAKAMREGAWGVSTGLIYTPGCFAQTDELVELAAVVARWGGIYVSHIRGEEKGTLLAAIREALEIGRRARIPVHISHLKASGPAAWGMIRSACELIEQAWADGLRVTADQYPYTASSTTLAALLIRPEAREGNRMDWVRRLEDPHQGPRLQEQTTDEIQQRGGPDAIVLATSPKDPSWVGQTLGEIARRTGKKPAEIVVELEKQGRAWAVCFSMSEEDVRYAMRKPYVATASDGSVQSPSPTKPHPRSYGSFARKIGRYALEWGVLPLEQAVRSCTGLPADILGLPDRGYLRPGYRADLVVFDLRTFRDQATFEDPHRYATGVVYLFVNGRLVLDRGVPTGALAGRPLRREKLSRVIRASESGGATHAPEDDP